MTFYREWVIAVPLLLTDLHILIVEDEYLIADDLARGLAGAGAKVIGPARSVAAARALLKNNINGAVLDINLNGELVFSFADELAQNGVRFVFTTGYDRVAIPTRFAHIERVEKPVCVDSVALALAFISDPVTAT